MRNQCTNANDQQFRLANAECDRRERCEQMRGEHQSREDAVCESTYTLADKIATCKENARLTFIQLHPECVV